MCASHRTRGPSLLDLGGKHFLLLLRVMAASHTRGIGRLEESGCRSLSAQRGWRLGAVELAEVVVHLEGGGDEDVDVGDDDDVDVGDEDVDVGDGDVGDDGVMVMMMVLMVSKIII